MKAAHEVFIAFTSFQPSEMMQMSEKDIIYWLERVEMAHERYGLKKMTL